MGKVKAYLSVETYIDSTSARPQKKDTIRIAPKRSPDVQTESEGTKNISRYVEEEAEKVLTDMNHKMMQAQLRKLPEQVEFMEEYVKELPESPAVVKILNVLGSSYARLGRIEEAKKMLNRAIELAGSDRFVNTVEINLAFAETQAGQLSDAEARLLKIMSLPVPESLNDSYAVTPQLFSAPRFLAKVYQKAGDIRRADEVLRRAGERAVQMTKENPDVEWLPSYIAGAYADRVNLILESEPNNIAAAKDLAEELKSHLPNNLVGPQGYGNIMMSIMAHENKRNRTEAAARLRANELGRRSTSIAKLRRLGLMLVIYINDHNGKYPNSLEEIKPYDKDEVLAWTLENVRYLGAGKNTAVSPQAVIAYDKTLRKEERGTTVLYNDGHTEFVKTSQLKRLGILKSQIKIETRILMVDPNFLEDIGLDSIEPNSVNNVSPMIDSNEVKFILKAAQAYKNAKSLTAPKVTVFDGEGAAIGLRETVEYISGYTETNSVSDEPRPEYGFMTKGINITVRPKLKSDDKTIFLELHFELTNLLGFKDFMYKDKYPYQNPEIEVVNIETEAAVRDGQTLLIDGRKITVQNEQGQTVPKMFLALVTAEKLEDE